MHDSPEAKISRLRDFLDTLDVARPTWKGKLEKFFILELYSLPQKNERIATFSVGDEDEDEIREEVDASLSKKESQDFAAQFPEVTNTKPSQTSMEELIKKWRAGEDVVPGDVLRLMRLGHIRSRELEIRYQNDKYVSVAIRRELVSSQQCFSFKNLPMTLPYSTKYLESCCENVIGFIPIPVGSAGPLTITDGQQKRTVFVPMATTEGALIASTNRGCNAIMKSKKIYSRVTSDQMTRAPVVKFSEASDAVKFVAWLEVAKNFTLVKEAFESTSDYSRLKKIEAKMMGRKVHIKFYASTGDAMGMNMISKGCEAAIKKLSEIFPEMELLALSGNYCTDKKASAGNWINGRGKSVVADCILSADVVKGVLKTTPKRMAEVARAKLEEGSSLAACIGGNNAHAANIVAAIFLATGQDAAQVVSSSMCQTEMTVTEEGSLYVSCTMPCIEVGTVGGGTILPPQDELLQVVLCLFDSSSQMLSCAGSNKTHPGNNAKFLAEVICATVMAGELSLMAALCTDELVSSHMTYNRSNLNLYNDRPISSQPTISLTAPTLRAQLTRHRTKQNSESIPGCSNIL